MGVFPEVKRNKKGKTIYPDNCSDMIYLRYRDLLRAAAVTIFDYKGAPESTNMLYFENVMLDKGTAAFLKPEGTEIILSCSWVPKSGRWTVYGMPRTIKGFSSAIDHNLIKTSEFEVAYDNVLAYGANPSSYSNTWQIIDNFAQLLWECENTFRSNMMHQNKPFILETNNNTKLSFAQFWNFFQDFRPYIMAEKGANIEEAIKTIDLKVDFRGQEILACRETIWNMAMNALGYSAGTTKKERELYHEVMLNRMAEGASLNARLAPRIDFCNRVNRHFGIDMSVNLREDPLIGLDDYGNPEYANPAGFKEGSDNVESV